MADRIAHGSWRVTCVQIQTQTRRIQSLLDAKNGLDNGVHFTDWSRGLMVGAVDGIEICSSYVRCCDACMQREIQHKVDGEMKTDIQYYHRIVIVALVSTPVPVPLGVRFQKNGETEVACGLALLKDLVAQLGRRFLDVLVGDALFLQAPFVKCGFR